MKRLNRTAEDNELADDAAQWEKQAGDGLADLSPRFVDYFSRTGTLGNGKVFVAATTAGKKSTLGLFAGADFPEGAIVTEYAQAKLFHHSSYHSYGGHLRYAD